MSLTAINVWPGIPARHAPHASSQHSGWVELSMASGGMKAKRSLGRPRERCSGSEAVRLRRGAFAAKRCTRPGAAPSREEIGQHERRGGRGRRGRWKIAFSR
jgi:hypothetical protein